jgi:outer membrane protein TolC
VQSSLYALRQQVNDAYFAVLQLQAQHDELETGITDLEAQHRVASDRVRNGAALPSEAALVEAELRRRKQSLADVDAERGAALDVLTDLTGHRVDPARPLALPDLANAVDRARAALRDVRARPEYTQFARARDVLAEEEASTSAQTLPRLSAFGRVGYGRPGLNPLGQDFDDYWLAGVQVEWTPWRWGATRRERQTLALQEQIVTSNEAAFTDALQRSLVRDLARIDRLSHSLAEDDTIIDVRERILRETRLRFGEGVITAAEYVDRQTDLLAARIARATHRVALAQARAQFLTSLGLEIR